MKQRRARAERITSVGLNCSIFNMQGQVMAPCPPARRSPVLLPASVPCAFRGLRADTGPAGVTRPFPGSRAGIFRSRSSRCDGSEVRGGGELPIASRVGPVSLPAQQSNPDPGRVHVCTPSLPGGPEGSRVCATDWSVRAVSSQTALVCLTLGVSTCRACRLPLLSPAAPHSAHMQWPSLTLSTLRHHHHSSPPPGCVHIYRSAHEAGAVGRNLVQ